MSNYEVLKLLVMGPAHFRDVTHDKMKSDVIKKYCRTTLEPLLNQVTARKLFLGRRRYPVN